MSGLELANLGRITSGALTLAAAPARLLVALEASLRNLDRIAAGVDAMHGEFLGMREDIRGLSGQVEVLTTEVATLAPPIDGIFAEMPLLNARVEQMDQRLATLSDELRPVGALAGRFSGGRRTRPPAAPLGRPEPGEPQRELPR
ncbi:MAG: hypothetical protein ACR2ND_01395 [Solirubrobacteraceae bacterium]